MNNTFISSSFENLCNEVLLESQESKLQFDIDPLSIVLSMKDEKISGPEIFETLLDKDSKNYKLQKQKVSANHIKKAKEIYDFFSKKYTLRILKNEHISNYMTSLNEICEDCKNIKPSHLNILVSLPRVYDQNLRIEKILKDVISVDKNLNDRVSVDLNLEFLEKLFSGYKKQYYYFWKDSNNNLFAINVNEDTGVAAWDFLSQQKKIHVKANGIVSKLSGYDFHYINLVKNIELSINTV